MASRKIGALWAKNSKSGIQFFSGVIQDLRGDIRIAVFKNEKKEGKQPDYNIVLSEEREEKEESRSEAPRESHGQYDPNTDPFNPNNDGSVPGDTPMESPKDAISIDDIPF